MDLILDLPQTKQNKNSILVVVDQILKMAHFIYLNKTNNALYVAKLLFRVIARQYRFPILIMC